jgi:hypothetical protein
MLDTNKAWEGANIHKDLKNKMENDIRQNYMSRIPSIIFIGGDWA